MERRSRHINEIHVKICNSIELFLKISLFVFKNFQVYIFDYERLIFESLFLCTTI